MAGGEPTNRLNLGVRQVHELELGGTAADSQEAAELGFLEIETGDAVPGESKLLASPIQHVERLVGDHRERHPLDPPPGHPAGHSYRSSKDDPLSLEPLPLLARQMFEVGVSAELCG